MTYLKTRAKTRINTDMVEAITPSTMFIGGEDRQVIVAHMPSGKSHVLLMTISEYLDTIGPREEIFACGIMEPVKTIPVEDLDKDH